MDSFEMRKKFNIPEYLLGTIKAKIAKTNKRFPDFTNIKLSTTNEYFKIEANGVYSLKYLTIEIIGEMPHFEGWAFVAMLDYDRVNKVVFVHGLSQTTPLPDQYKNKTKIDCDHCGHKRFRTKSFIIYNDAEKKYMEVGSTCLKKFFKSNVSKLVPFVDAIQNLDCYPEKKTSDKADFYVNALDFFISVKYMIDKYGWISQAEKQKQWNVYEKVIESTKDRAIKLMGSHEMLKIKTKQIKYSKTAVAFFANQENNGSDYLINLIKTCQIEKICSKKLGVAASIFSAYERHIDQKKREEKIDNESNSGHVGNLGERLEKIQVVVKFKKSIGTQYGESTLYRFEDIAGNIYTSFYSGHAFDLKKDDIIFLTGTVKKHDVFRGEKQTILNRIVCKAF